MKFLITFAVFVFLALLLHCKSFITKDISDKPCHIMDISENGIVTISNVNRDVVIRSGPRKGYLDKIGELSSTKCAKLKKFIDTQVKGCQITGEVKKDSTLHIKYYKKDQNGSIDIRSLNNDFIAHMQKNEVLIAQKK